jgi:hypothetical protein
LEDGGCTTFDIGSEAEKCIRRHAGKVKDLLALVSRAARRKTSEGTGPLIVHSELDFAKIAAEQDASEQPQQ